MKRVMLVIVHMYAGIHMVNTGVHRVNAQCTHGKRQ